MTNLGPFRLERLLGSGGMGSVWEGVHLPSGVPVALKVVRSRSAARPQEQALFLREVHATATLDHPRIVRTLDAGLVPPQAAGGPAELVAGSPWLAMELVRGSPLGTWRGRLPWGRLKHLALELLDALAHAHARGIVHRDLKPANVLVDRSGLPNLLDFGIAARATTEGALELVASGTPAYMAPEQTTADGRDTGPWTDLFAFGALIWAMVSGKPPFSAAKGPAAVVERLRPLPTLQPTGMVPAALEPWLRTLMQPDPRSRYQRAADAARDLRAMPDGHTERARWIRPAPEDPTLRVPTSGTPGRALSSAPTVLLPGTSRPTLFDRPGPPAPAASPVPERPPVRGARPRLAGTGLGLWGLRDPPFVGRLAERDALWGLWREVDRGGVRAVVLTGAPGCGKSRLARWLCEEAHEAGASVSRAVHGPTPAPGHGLAAMVARDLGCQGLSGEALRERLARLLPDPTAARGLCALLEGAGGDRHPAWVDHLARTSAARPVVVWLDDLLHGPDAQGALLHLLASRARADLRVLVVATADVVGPEPALEELEKAGAVRRELGGLGAGDVLELVGGLVGLGARVASDLAERADGSPLFAVQLVSDWIGRGLLVPTSYGYDLPPGARPEVPADLVGLWTARVEEALEGLRPTDGEAIERAAILGARIEPDLWRRACALDGYAPSAWLVERFATRGLLVPAGEGWAFAHGLLVGALERRAGAGGRIRAHHLAAAAVVGAADPSRAGFHLLAGGRPEEALPHLLEGATRRRVSASDYRGALADLARAEQALDLLEADDARRGEVWDEQATCLRATGRYREARTVLDRVLARLEEPGWGHLAGPVRLTASQIARDAGDLVTAEAHAVASLVAAEAAGNDDGRATALIELGYVAWWSRDLVKAEERFRESLGLPSSELRRADVQYALALTAVAREDAASALQHLALAEPIYEAHGQRLGLARCSNARGSALTLGPKEGALDPERRELAMASWRRALELYASVGSGDDVIPRLNLATILVQLGRDEEALATLEPGRWRFDEGRPFFAGVLELLRAAALARGGPRAAFRAALQRADELLARAPRRDTETADIALRMTATLRDPDDAAAAAALALVLCRRSGDPARIARAQALARGDLDRDGTLDQG